MTKCSYGYQTFSFSLWQAVFSPIISIFGSKIQHFSTFGSNQDDHVLLAVTQYVHLC